MKKLTFLFLGVLLACCCSAQIKHPCNQHPEIRDNFPLTKQAHSYVIEDLICTLPAGSTMTADRIFHIMLENAKYIAPFAKEVPVEPCGMVLLNDEWHIVTDVDWVHKSVTNYTMPDHILFEGKVIRKIVQRGNKIYLTSIGSGNNKDRTIRWLNNNHTTMETLWHTVDEYLKEEVEKRMEPLTGHWVWIDWAQMPAGTLEQLKSFKEWEGMSAYDNILKNIRQGCRVQVAALDLDGDKKPGIAVRVSGETCCNIKKECPFTVYEADGYKRIYLIDNHQSLVKPANHGLISSAGAFFEFQDFTQLMNSK